jgi:hypothetical protein
VKKKAWRCFVLKVSQVFQIESPEFSWMIVDENGLLNPVRKKSIIVRMQQVELCWVYVMVFLVDEMTTLSQALWSRSHPTVGQLTSQIFVEELTLLFLISVVSVSFVCLSLRYGLAFAVSLAYSTGLSLV